MGSCRFVRFVVNNICDFSAFCEKNISAFSARDLFVDEGADRFTGNDLLEVAGNIHIEYVD